MALWLIRAGKHGEDENAAIDNRDICPPPKSLRFERHFTTPFPRVKEIILLDNVQVLLDESFAHPGIETDL